MKNILIAGFTLVLIFGCSMTQTQFMLESSMIIEESSELKSNYTKVEALLRDKQERDAVFTESEWRKLLNVDATIDMLIARVDNIMRFNTTNVSLTEIEFLWGLSVTGYNEARSVIFAHWDSFSPSTQLLLSTFDTKAEITSTMITDLMENPDNDSMTQALTLITGIVSIAVKMLAIAI